MPVKWGVEILSDREVELVKLLAAGKRNKEIAAIWGRSTSTVTSIRERVLSKLDVKDNSSIVHFALYHKLVENEFSVQEPDSIAPTAEAGGEIYRLARSGV